MDEVLNSKNLSVDQIDIIKKSGLIDNSSFNDINNTKTIPMKIKESNADEVEIKKELIKQKQKYYI